MKIARNQKGFTLIEILLVVAAIAILAGIVIVAVNPAKQLAATRDAERQSEVNTLLNAINQIQISDAAAGSSILSEIPLSLVNEALPEDACDITEDSQEICMSTPTGDCADGIDLTALVPEYISSIPQDPTIDTIDNSNYFAVRLTNSSGIATGRIAVCAGAETDGLDIISFR